VSIDDVAVGVIKIRVGCENKAQRNRRNKPPHSFTRARKREKTMRIVATMRVPRAIAASKTTWTTTASSSNAVTCRAVVVAPRVRSC